MKRILYVYELETGRYDIREDSIESLIHSTYDWQNRINVSIDKSRFYDLFNGKTGGFTTGSATFLTNSNESFDYLTKKIRVYENISNKLEDMLDIVHSKINPT
jgi:hypothetical protein